MSESAIPIEESNIPSLKCSKNSRQYCNSTLRKSKSRETLYLKGLTAICSVPGQPLLPSEPSHGPNLFLPGFSYLRFIQRPLLQRKRPYNLLKVIRSILVGSI